MPIVLCDNCGQPVERSNWKIARFKHFFCNKRCKGDWMIGRYSVDEYTAALPYRVIKRGGKSVKEHRVVVEKEVGRILGPEEHVHHRNRKKFDNSPDNLFLMEGGDHMSLHHRLVLDVESIKSDRSNKETISGIAKKHGVSRSAIARRLKDEGIDTSVRFIGWDTDAAIKMLADGVSQAETARILSIPETTLRGFVKSRGIKCGDSRNKNVYDWDVINPMLDSGVSIREVARRIGVSYGALHKALANRRDAD